MDTYAKDRPIYERQPCEGRWSWQAFCIYRSIGPERTVWAVCEPLQILFGAANTAATPVPSTGTAVPATPPAKKFPSKKKIASIIEKWWKEHRWWERAGAWDRSEAQKKERARRLAIEEMEERHVLESKALQKKALERLQNMNYAELKEPRDVLRFLEVSQKLEIVARGKPERVTQQQITGSSGGPVRTLNAHAHGQVTNNGPVRIIETIVSTREEVKQLLDRGLMSGDNVIGGS